MKWFSKKLLAKQSLFSKLFKNGRFSELLKIKAPVQQALNKLPKAELYKASKKLKIELLACKSIFEKLDKNSLIPSIITKPHKSLIKNTLLPLKLSQNELKLQINTLPSASITKLMIDDPKPLNLPPQKTVKT